VINQSVVLEEENIQNVRNSNIPINEISYSIAETDSFIENINKNISKICSDKDFRSSWEARESVQAIIDLLVRSTNISDILEELRLRGLDYLTKKIPDSELKNLFFKQIDPRCLGKLSIYFKISQDIFDFDFLSYWKHVLFWFSSILEILTLILTREFSTWLSLLVFCAES
jgi:hypothetical protein